MEGRPSVIARNKPKRAVAPTVFRRMIGERVGLVLGSLRRRQGAANEYANKTTTTVAVRAAEPADLPQLGELELAAGARFSDVGLADVAAHDPPPLTTFAEAQRRGHLWVATLPADAVDPAEPSVRQEVVGYAWALDLDGQAHLEQLSVLPQHGGKGVGVALVDRVLGWAAEVGGTSLTLSCFVDVAWNGPWYERLGFVPISADELAGDRRWQELRHHEESAGLDLSRRTVMRRPLAQRR